LTRVSWYANIANKSVELTLGKDTLFHGMIVMGRGRFAGADYVKNDWTV